MTQIPNLHQMTRSNLVQVKKNKTLHWLSQLPDSKQAVIDMAVQRRRQVTQVYKDEEQMRKKHRQQAMIRDNAK